MNLTDLRKASADLIWLSDWIDNSPNNALRDREAALWGRVAKIGEEFGEAIQALIGATNQNPRKGITHDMGHVRKELFDVAITALGAVEHIDAASGDGGGKALPDLVDAIHVVRVRAEASSDKDAMISQHHYFTHGFCIHGEVRGDCSQGGY
jgi:hypothetical protein